MSVELEKAVAVIPRGSYVAAVSGGVDSVVLLDMLTRQKKLELIVAHFDHGIRPDSHEDKDFVEQLARKYGLAFKSETAQLGTNASEAEARTARYRFLYRIKEENNCNKIITAHHKDDLLETVIINILRGTGRRGFSSLRSTQDIERPLLDFTKSELIEYAREHDLQWREDPTNVDIKYFRNRIRHKLIPKAEAADPGFKDKLFTYIDKVDQLNQEIEPLLSETIQKHVAQRESETSMPRAWFAELPVEVAKEILYEVIRELDPEPRMDRAKLMRLLDFVQSHETSKWTQVSGQSNLRIEKETIVIYRSETGEV